MSEELENALNESEGETQTPPEVVRPDPGPPPPTLPDVPFIEIDYAGKTMNIPSYYRTIAVEGDYESRRVYFKLIQCPDEITVLGSAIEIFYVNAEKNVGRYLVEDARKVEDFVIFSFPIRTGLTVKAGQVSLSMLIHGEGYQWRISPVNLTVARFPDVEPIEFGDPRYDLLNQVMEYVASIGYSADSLDERMTTMETQMTTKIDDLMVVDGYIYTMANGVAVGGPYGPFSGGAGGGGGGGQSTNNAVLSVRNVSGWTSKTISENSQVVFSVEWSSLEDGETPTGNGNAKVTCNGELVADLDIPQGLVDIDVSRYVHVGNNTLMVTIRDVYSNLKTYMFTVKVIALNLTSAFDDSMPLWGDTYYTFVATGSTDKTMHFILDGEEIGTMLVATTGRQNSFLIAGQTHGAHSFEAYFTAEVAGNNVESNHLRYQLMFTDPNSQDTVITAVAPSDTVRQYETIVINYSSYNPSMLETEVELYVNGLLQNTLRVNRQRQQWSYRAMEVGPVELKIKSGDTQQIINLTVTPVELHSTATEENLVLHLSSYGRSNAEANPATWTYRNIRTTFRDFNWMSDGWQLDNDGITCLRLLGDARLTINYQPFAADFRQSGKTMEFEFATHSVRDYDAPVISCLDGNRGLVITAQEARLTSEASTISRNYRDGEHVRVSFVVEKRGSTQLINCYINGEYNRAIAYPNNDDFEQMRPAVISIGSNDCGIDLYTIRIYDQDLTRIQMLDNRIADEQDGGKRQSLDALNNIYNEYGQIQYPQLPKNLPVMILDEGDLPARKGDPKSVSGRYMDPADPSNNFTFENASFDVQGTSSQHYYVKNFKAKFQTGFVMEDE